MGNSEFWQSPLEPLTSKFMEGLSEVSIEAQINLRGNPDDPEFLTGAKKALGLGLPLEPNTVSFKKGIKILWLGPNEWQIVSTKPGGPLLEKLEKSLVNQHVAITDVSANRVVLQIAGPNKYEVLKKSCEMDFHPREFAPGQVVQTLLAKAPAMIEQVDDNSFHIYVRNSFARYCAEWLVDAFEEYQN
ncbi:MAG: hypothetical protein JKX94_09755 [Sneathiella sp.]|nr:hypothetical protein [Sneathiella sp.]